MIRQFSITPGAQIFILFSIDTMVSTYFTGHYNYKFGEKDLRRKQSTFTPILF